MSKVLTLTFATSKGKKANMNIPDVKPNITGAEVKVFGEKIIATNCVGYESGVLTKLVAAKMFQKEAENITID